MLEMKDEQNAGRAKRIREKRRRKALLTRYALVGTIAVLVVAVIVLAVQLAKSSSTGSNTPPGGGDSAALSSSDSSGTGNASTNGNGDTSVNGDAAGNSDLSGNGASGNTDGSDSPAQPAGTSSALSDDLASVLSEAKRLAASYDYDSAISKLEAVKAQDASGEVQKAIAEFEAVKETLVDVDITTIPHVFFHSLIADTSLAFHNDKARAEDYNRVMTTISEFNKMMQQMYERGYVLVSLHQMGQYTKQADGSGKMVAGKISLPEGKKPFVLSIDDMSYYAYMMTDGFATKLVIGEDGRLTSEMEKNDGTLVYGSFDVVPLLDDFVIEHPDFSYQGAKGIIALTGYDGVFGYRTDQDYYLKEHLLSNQAEWLDAHPGFDYEKDIAEAKRVAQALRDDGWEMATHSWGHRDMRENSFEKFKVDMQKWIDRVETIIGETDIVIYPFGTDVGTVSPYTMDNEKYAWLHDNGFYYFCNVDSNQPWVQLGNQFLRQGRIDADGWMMYYHPEKLKAFFDVDSVFDSARPLPVPDY